MNVRVAPCKSSSDAVQYGDACGGQAILLDGKPAVVSSADAQRLELAAVEFAYLCDHEMSDGSRRIITVPID